MFYGRFQTGGSLELYNPNNKELMNNWTFVGKSRKVYDKSVKSYMQLLDTGGLSKMKMPKDNVSLGIVQGYVVFQIYLFSQKNFSIEISFSDTQKIRHRLIFSANLRDLNMNYFTCVIPMAEVPLGTWVNLSIDVLSFVSYCFKDLTFKSIDNIMFSASAKVRRIFTMRGRINDSNNNINNNSDISGVSSLNRNIESETIPKDFLIKGDNIDVVNINMHEEVCIDNPILKDKFYNKKPKFPNKSYLFSNITNISKIYDKNKKVNSRSNSKNKNEKKEKSNFKLSDKYDNNNDNDKNLNINVVKVIDPKNKELNDNYYRNQRYNLANRIGNTKEPVIISNGSNSISSSMKSKVTSKFNNQIINSFSNSESQKINELINSNEINEEMLDDKGQIYFDSNLPNLNKETFQYGVSQVTQSMENLNKNMNKEKAGQFPHLNNKENNEVNPLRFSSVERIALKNSQEGRPYSPPLTKINNEK